MPDQAPDGSIVITPKEFYDGVRQDIESINRGVSALREELSGLPARVNKLEEAVSALQTRQAWLAGAAAGLGATVGTIASRLLS